MGGTGERFQTRGDKSLTMMEMAGLGACAKGTNGKVAWAEDPVQGHPATWTAPRPSRRASTSSWNADMQAGELFAKLESRDRAGPGRRPLECVVATPKLGRAAAQLLRRPDAPSSVTVRSARNSAGRHAFSRRHARLARRGRGEDPVREQHPARARSRWSTSITTVIFDEPMDDKMFEPPAPARGRQEDERGWRAR